jgi:SAM-dependent methyltransferase
LNEQRVSIEPLPFEPRRFQTAAAHYLAGRPAYAPRLIARVVELCSLGAAHRVLDLGCGPGQLAAAFAPFCAEVLGIDPEPEMLRLARQNARPNASWLEGSSYDLGPDIGKFRLVVMGRSFHWMDRVDTLRRLDEIVEPGGAVALFKDSHPDLPENAMRQQFRALLDAYAPAGDYRGPRAAGWVPHASLLLDSVFSMLEEISVIERRAATVDMLVDRAFSMSTTSRSRLGDRAAALEADIRALGARLAPTGHFTEVVATTALIARRK